MIPKKFQLLRLQPQSLDLYHIEKGNCSQIYFTAFESALFREALFEIPFEIQPLVIVLSQDYFDLRILKIPAVSNSDIEYFVNFELRKEFSEESRFWCFVEVVEDEVEITILVAILHAEYSSIVEALNERSGIQLAGMFLDVFLKLHQQQNHEEMHFDDVSSFSEFLRIDYAVSDEDVFAFFQNRCSFKQVNLCVLPIVPKVKHFGPIFIAATLLIALSPVAGSVRMIAERQSVLDSLSDVDQQVSKFDEGDFGIREDSVQSDGEVAMLERKIDLFQRQREHIELLDFFQNVLLQLGNTWVNEFTMINQNDVPVSAKGRFIFDTPQLRNSNELYELAEDRLRILCRELRGFHLVKEVSGFSVDYSFLDQEIPIIPFTVTIVRNPIVLCDFEQEIGL